VRHRREEVRLQPVQLLEPRDRLLQALVVLRELGERQAHRLFVHRRRELARIRVVDQQAKRVRRQIERRLGPVAGCGQLRERLAVVGDIAGRRACTLSSRELFALRIEHRDLGPERAAHCVDELFQLRRWHQSG